jgi:hypothetical protein
MEGFLGFRAGRWDAAVLAAIGKAARRAPRPRGRGGARHRTQLGHAKRGNPVTVRRERPPAGRQQRGIRGGTRTAQEANGGSRKAAGKRVHMAGPSRRGRARITGRIPGLGARARKGADVSRVAL